MEFENALRRTFEVRVTVGGTAAAVFPLLCPVLEYDWLPGWAGVMIYSGSGVAELGCVFQTRHDTRHDTGDETWVVSRYRPQTAISFVRVLPGRWTVLMELDLSPAAQEETALRVRHAFTALSPAGAAAIEAMDAADHADQWRYLARAMGHWLSTGTMLAPTPTPTPTATAARASG